MKHNGRRKRVKNILIVLVSLMALLALALIFQPGVIPFFLMQTESIQHAGTWEDDPGNWRRAFDEEQPAQVKVVHSKYWRSNHFTYEFIYYFEVKATPEWTDAFLRKKNLALVSPSSARSFRVNNDSHDTPSWFAPDPVELYDVWDQPGYTGSVWINKTNGHIFFYDAQL
jgi:hypothetical protein